MARTILHLDLDAFFCAVEELLDPSLKGKAFAVGGTPEDRGVIASCSYAARSYGVHSAMPTNRALRLCPQLIVISHHRGNYGETSDQVMARLRDLSPYVEQISIDEAFVDLSGLEEPVGITRRLQAGIRKELGLPCSAGIASNKLVAKIATEVGKKTGKKGEPPNALTEVPPGTEAAFLDPLPVEMMWGVGPKTGARLAEFGIKTIGDLAHHPEEDLVRWFGSNGRDMWQHAHGRDERPIVTEYEAKSISQETTFARDVGDDLALQRTLRSLAAEVGRRLRKSRLSGTTVKLKLRWPDFTSLTRQTSLLQPTDQDEEIYQTGLALLQKVRTRGQEVRLIGVGVSGFKPPLRQLELWDGGNEKMRKLQKAVDDLQEKYGRKIIQRGKV
jgi:DNA polymerase-4